MNNTQFHTHGLALYNNKVWKGMNTLHRFTALLLVLLLYSVNTWTLCGGCCLVRCGHETTPSIASLLFPVIQLLPILDRLLLPFTYTYTNTGKCKHSHYIVSHQSQYDASCCLLLTLILVSVNTYIVLRQSQHDVSCWLITSSINYSVTTTSVPPVPFTQVPQINQLPFDL